MNANESILRPAHGVVREAFADEVVIINLDSGTYYSLNGSGVTVLTSIEAGASLETLVAVVAARYNAETTRIETDVRALIDRLLAEQLVSEDSGGTKGPVMQQPEGEKRLTSLPSCQCLQTCRNFCASIQFTMSTRPVGLIGRKARSDWLRETESRCQQVPRHVLPGSSSLSLQIQASLAQSTGWGCLDASSRSAAGPCASSSRAMRWCRYYRQRLTT